MGIYISAFSLAGGFALIWHIWWLAIIGLLGVITLLIVRSTDDETEYVIPAAEVRKIVTARREKLA